MKTLATFFVTLLLLAGSAWAQTQTATGTGTLVATIAVTAKASTGSGSGIWDEVVVNAIDGTYGYELNVSALQRPADVSLVDAYVAVGREAVKQGMARGYTAHGSTATVWTSDHSYVMRFQASDGIVLISFEGGSIQ